VFDFKLKIDVILSTVGLFLLAGCSSHIPAPVIDLSQSADHRLSFKPGDYHTVAAGETLFSIAWRYGLDFRTIAELNEIDNRYRIYPGQQIHLAPQQKSHQSDNFNSARLQAAVYKALGQSVPTNISTKASKQASLKVSDDSRQKAGSVVSVDSTKKKVKKRSRQRPSSSGNGRTRFTSVNRWTWPIKGPIIDRFSKQLHGNKGLDISADLGQPVRAAASGRVVYQGSSLKGYGNLIIVKHNEEYLSAYAHNSKIRVRENEIVKAGQVIADIGRTGTDQNKLHFEIRYQGKPVDPIKYLPKL
jgi:lipoprotein NlpD